MISFSRFRFTRHFAELLLRMLTLCMYQALGMYQAFRMYHVRTTPFFERVPLEINGQTFRVNILIGNSKVIINGKKYQ